MKNLSFYKIEIEPDKNKRIDQLIALELPEYSRSRIKNWINRKNITINGESCSPKDKILKKSIIEIRILENEELDIKPQKINLNVSYEDKDILIHGDGSQTRSFTWVDDVIGGFVKAGILDVGLDGSELTGLAFNIGSTEEVSISQLAEKIIDASSSNQTLIEYSSGYSARRRFY